MQLPRAMRLYRATRTLSTPCSTPSEVLRRRHRLVGRRSVTPVPSVRVPIRIAVDLPVPVRRRGAIREQAVAARVSVRGVAIRLAVRVRAPVGGGGGGGVGVAVAVGVGVAVAVDDVGAAAAGAHFQRWGAVGFACAAGAFAVRGGEEVDEEGEDPEGEDEGDDPFEDGGLLGVPVEGEDGEDDGEGDCRHLSVTCGVGDGLRLTLDEDKCQLEPEGDSEDTSVSEVDAQSLIFGAEEYGRYDVTSAVRLKH